MMNQPAALKFFWVILRPSRATLAALLAVLLYASYLASMSGDGFDAALSLILLTQLLVASTGYRDRLVRGHFDSILAGSRRRAPVALAHAILSMVPGLVVWVIFGAVQHLVTSRWSIALMPGGLVTFLYASVVVWAVSLRLGRNSGGVIWVFVAFVLAGVGRVHVLREAYGTSSASVMVTARSIGAALVFPIVMLGNDGYVERPVLLGVCLATVAVLVSGIWMIVRFDAPLKDPA
jgi:hypothetical protein